MAELQSIINFRGRHFVRHLGICNRICVKLVQLMYAVITHNSLKKKRSLYINKWLSYSQLQCSRRHFVRHLGICNPIFVKFLQIMSGVIPRNLKKHDVPISNRFPEVHKRRLHRHTDTHTQTHDDSIKRNVMRCILPKNTGIDLSIFNQLLSPAVYV